MLKEEQKEKTLSLREELKFAGGRRLEDPV